VKIHDLFSLVHFLGRLSSDRSLKPRNQIFGGGVCLCDNCDIFADISITFLTPAFIFCVKQNHLAWVAWALFSECRLGHELRCVGIETLRALSEAEVGCRHWHARHLHHLTSSMGWNEGLRHHASESLALVDVAFLLLVGLLCAILHIHQKNN
jgi:hypothetical protein